VWAARFDFYGASDAVGAAEQIEIKASTWGRCVFGGRGWNYIVDESSNQLIAGSAETCGEQLQALRAKTGVRGPLWRSRQDDDVREWITAAVCCA
jgi:hypothetical protein